MNCPSCGLSLQGVNAATCPRCGQPIAAANQYGAAPASYPGAPVGYEQPPAPMAYGQAEPPQPGYGPPTDYGAPAGYGMPAGYGPPAGYGAQVPPPPPPPAKRSGKRRVIGLVAGALVLTCVAILVVAGLLGNRITQSPLPGVTATVSGKWIYRQTLTSSTSSLPNDSNCSFANGGYQIQGGSICYPDVSDVAAGTATVQVKQTSGDSNGAFGIVFRRVSSGNYYAFYIGNDGTWIAAKCVNKQCAPLGTPGQSQAIQTGLNTVNTLQVHMSGTHFDFLVNGVTVGSADDSTFKSGKVGLGVETGEVCVFNNMEVTI